MECIDAFPYAMSFTFYFNRRRVIFYFGPCYLLLVSFLSECNRLKIWIHGFKFYSTADVIVIIMKFWLDLGFFFFINSFARGMYWKWWCVLQTSYFRLSLNTSVMQKFCINLLSLCFFFFYNNLLSLFKSIV